MTKSSFEALKAEYADTCCMIGLDNCRALFIGYGTYQIRNLKTGDIRYSFDKNDIRIDPNTKKPCEELVDENPTEPISMNDLSIVTKGDEDFIEVHYYHKRDNGREEYELISFIPLDQVQAFVVCPTKTKEGKRILPNRHGLN